MPLALSPPPVPFRPNSTLTTGTLRGWWKSDAGLYQDSAGLTPAALDLDPVGRWTDQSGQGNHWIQTVDASRPLYRTATGFDEHPEVQFNGSAYHLTCDGLASIFSGSDKAFTLLVVARMTGTGTAQAILGVGRSTVATPAIIYGRSALAPYTLRRDDSNSQVIPTYTTSALSGSSARVLAYTFSGSQIAAQIGGNAAETFSQDVGTLTLDRVTLGALRRNVTGSYFGGYLQEIILVELEAVAREVTLEMQYLKGRHHTP